MPPKADATKQLEDMLARIQELELKEKENLKKIEKLQNDNNTLEGRIKILEEKLLNDNNVLEGRIKVLEEKKTNGVLDFSKLFDRKSNKSTEEISLRKIL